MTKQIVMEWENKQSHATVPLKGQEPFKGDKNSLDRLQDLSFDTNLDPSTLSL